MLYHAAMLELSPVREAHAEALFPLVFRTGIADTLVWDGPESIEQLRDGLRERELATQAGRLHVFAILKPDGTPIGCIDIVPDLANAAGAIGLWIGRAFHGKGHGTEAVRRIVQYGFGELALERLHANVFVGNMASRRIFEKNGFTLEGTMRHALRKRGVFVDEWLFGMVREDFERKPVR